MRTINKPTRRVVVNDLLRRLRRGPPAAIGGSFSEILHEPAALSLSVGVYAGENLGRRLCLGLTASTVLTIHLVITGVSHYTVSIWTVSRDPDLGHAGIQIEAASRSASGRNRALGRLEPGTGEETGVRNFVP